MSTSEQELKGQIAGMREALQSARASARAGRIVGILGVVVGLCVVLCYVVAFINMGKEVAQPDKFLPIIRERVEMLQLEHTLTKVAREAAPVYVAEGRKLLEDMDLPEVLKREFELARADIEPVARKELERVAPQLEKMLTTQKEKTLTEMQSRLEKKLGDRLSSTVRRQETRLKVGGLNQESLALLVTNLQDACLNALRTVVEKRMGNVRGEMDKIVKEVAQLPPLPASSREAVLHEMVLVLVALLRENLPAYEDVNLMSPAIGKAGPEAATPEVQEAAWAAEAAEARRKVAEEQARREADNE